MANSTDSTEDSSTIVEARISAMPEKVGDPMPVVYIKTSRDGEERRLFEYYPDELSFSADEFVGLTLSQARQLKARRDGEYLRS